MQKGLVLVDASSTLSGIEVKKACGKDGSSKGRSVLSTQPYQAAYNSRDSSSRGPDVLFWPQWTFAHRHIHMPQIKRKIIKKIKITQEIILFTIVTKILH